MAEKKLNLGCGKKIKERWINLDSVDLPGVDVVRDIEKLPLPFDDEEFDEIICDNVLEHVEYIPVLKVLYRIFKPGGQLKIRVPHFNSHTSFGDPTHRKFFFQHNFRIFCRQYKIPEGVLF